LVSCLPVPVGRPSSRHHPTLNSSAGQNVSSIRSQIVEDGAVLSSCIVPARPACVRWRFLFDYDTGIVGLLTSLPRISSSCPSRLTSLFQAVSYCLNPTNPIPTPPKEKILESPPRASIFSSAVPVASRPRFGCYSQVRTFVHSCTQLYRDSSARLDQLNVME
jgi:hypothetical protein